MITDLKIPVQVNVDRFKIDYKKDQVNPYMTKKLLKKRYEALGYKTIQGDDFETNLLLVFVRRTKFIDKYIKVKLGEYRRNQKTEEYNLELLDIFDFETIQKLLFICRICSYIGDPGFPDFIVYKKKEGRLPSDFRVHQSEQALRYVYTGDELLSNRLVFILLSRLFGIEIKFAAIDFTDRESQENVEVDMLKALEKALQLIEKRVNMENSIDETSIDLKVLRNWINSKQIDGEGFLQMYNRFVEISNSASKLKGLVSTLSTLNTKDLLGNKEKPEKLKALRDVLGVNMMEAIDVLNMWEIINH